MTTEAPRRGRPPYTPEQQTFASISRLRRNTVLTAEGCHITTVTDVTTAEGKRARPAAFMWRTYRADQPLESGDTVRATCGHADCINLEHLVRIPRKTDRRVAEAVGGTTVIAEPDTVPLTPENTEKVLRWLIAKEKDPEMKARQEQSLAEFLAKQASSAE